MIRFDTYKGRPALIVESDRLSLTLLPQDGGKIASLVSRLDGKELLLTKEGEDYRPLSYDGSYVDAECSAFDDMFPTIDPYTPKDGEYCGVTYPDHGEVCRIPYDANVKENKVILGAQSKLFSVRYQKTVGVSSGGGIEISYEIVNEGDEPFPCLWAGHIMLQGEDGMRLETSFGEDAPREMIFCTKGYDENSLPTDRLIGFLPGKGAAYKFYYTDPIKDDGFAVRYPNGRRLTVSYDRNTVPYLGVWLNNGEFQDIYNIAPEPCTAPFDAPDRAERRGYTASIPPKGVLAIKLCVDIQ